MIFYIAEAAPQLHAPIGGGDPAAGIVSRPSPTISHPQRENTPLQRGVL